MRIIVVLIALTLGVKSLSQNYPRTEILLGVSSQDNSIPIGNNHYADSLKPQKGTYTNTSFGAYVLVKFYRSMNAAFRIKTQFMTRNIANNFETNSPYIESSSTFLRQNILRLSPGFQWGIQQNKVEFFCGIEIPVAYIGNTQYESRYSFAFQTNPNAPIYITKVESSIPGGFSVAGGLFFGSSFRPNKNLVFGFELSGNYGFTSVGGNISTNYEATIGSNYSITHQSYEEKIQLLSFSMLQANFSVGINF